MAYISFAYPNHKPQDGFMNMNSSSSRQRTTQHNKTPTHQTNIIIGDIIMLEIHQERAQVGSLTGVGGLAETRTSCSWSRCGSILLFDRQLSAASKKICGGGRSKRYGGSRQTGRRKDPKWTTDRRDEVQHFPRKVDPNSERTHNPSRNASHQATRKRKRP